MLESLWEELSSDESRANMAKLDGVSELADAIRKAQDTFTAANDVYAKAKGSKAESATGLKKPLLSAINDKTVPYLSAMAFSGNASLADFSKNLDSEISRLNDNIAKRQKKATAADENPKSA